MKRILANPPAPDELRFIDALRARADRIGRELAWSVSQAGPAHETGTATPPPTQLATKPPPEVQPGAPRRAEGRHGPPEPRRRVFHVPGHPDVLVSQADWEAIQRLLSSRSAAETVDIEQSEHDEEPRD